MHNSAPMSVTVRSKEWFCGSSLDGIVGSNPEEGMNICILWVLRVVFIQDYASVWSLVQRILAEGDVCNECNHAAPSGKSMARNGIESLL